ncbi:MAG: signal peptidase I [Deltaproteobacteria bacterium]|uniref:Signal peptidase I n=1 Tax=Candidatus Zymogenus saltonus TaxID=2844893 RepID=A0A9D8PP13_9DELT|nr:signal peptidase I [Candidatus Zymogenus saltonus]
MFRKLGDKDIGFYGTAALFILVFFLYVLLFDNVLITSPVMEPGLKSGDYVLVGSASYNLSVPIGGRPFEIKKPKRGDIVFFEKEAREDDGAGTSSVLRVVGVPGDTVEIVDKKVFIDGKPIREPYVTLSDEKLYPGSISERDNLGPFIVPADSYFLLGDRRDVTMDSRFFGFITSGEIKGKVVFIYWSTNPARGIFRDIRLNRIGFLRSSD